MNDNELQTMEEIPQTDPDAVSDPVSETPVPEAPAPDDMPGQNDATSENPVNTGIPEPSPDPGNDKKNENAEEIPPQDDQEQTGEENTDEETDTGEDGETEENGNVTNITIVRPPAQITYQADEDATYHAVIENAESDPLPVVVTETLVEKEPGIMEKRLEDYTVTEGLLLCILIVLVLRMVFDYGRRLF